MEESLSTTLYHLFYNCTFTLGLHMGTHRDLHRVATMYYLQNQTMSAIARDLDVSQSTVSRLLKEARDEGLVRISIDPPPDVGMSLGAQISKRYRVRTYIVPVRDNASDQYRLEQIAKVAARLISGYLKEGMTLAVAWGRTTSEVGAQLPRQPIGNINVLQLNGAANVFDSGMIHANSVMTAFAEALEASIHYFPAPAFFDYPESKVHMWKESSIVRIRDLIGSADIAVFGAGSIDSAGSQLYAAGYLSPDDMAELRSQGVVGDVCTYFLRHDGSYRDIAINQRASGPSPAELRRIPIRICVAAGVHKAQAVRAALAARTVTDLVIDESIAKSLVPQRNF